MQYPSLPTNVRLYRGGLIALFVWLLLEGALRKWVVPGLATPLFFVKYLIVFYITGYFILNRERLPAGTYSFIAFYLFFLFYCLLEQFNFDVTDTPIVGIIGIVLHLGFSPLIFLLPKVITRAEHLIKIYRYLALIAIPILILGVVQYFSPPDSFINRYVVEDMDIAMVGDHVRITSVFSYLAGHSSFLIFIMPFFFIYLTAHLKDNKSNTLLFLAVFMLGVLNVLMTGARSCVALVIADIVLISAGFALGWGGEGVKIDSFVGKLAGMGFIVFMLLAFTEQGRESLDSFISRVDNSSHDVDGRVVDQLSPFKFLEKSGLIGFGIGTSYEGNEQFLTGRDRMPKYWEEEAERVVIELGLVGFLLCTALRIAIFAFSVRTMFTVSNGTLKQVALVVAVLQLPALIYFNLAIFNFTENALYWTGVGLVAAVYQIDQNEKRKAASLSVASR